MPQYRARTEILIIKGKYVEKQRTDDNNTVRMVK